MPGLSHYFLILIPILLKIPTGKFGRHFTNPQTDFVQCCTLKMGGTMLFRYGVKSQETWICTALRKPHSVMSRTLVH